MTLPPEQAPTLAELGVGKRESADAQAMAGASTEEYARDGISPPAHDTPFAAFGSLQPLF